jgi:hypothetical protein
MVGIVAALGGGVAGGQGTDPLDKLELDGGLLSWDGIRLGMTIPMAERRTGQTLAIEKSKAGGCPAFIAYADQHGTSLTLGFASPKPSGKIEWIEVRFEGYQIQASGSDLQASLHRKFPDAKYIPSTDAGVTESDDLEPDYAIPGKQPQQIRFYPREKMILGTASCMG